MCQFKIAICVQEVYAHEWGWDNLYSYILHSFSVVSCLYCIYCTYTGSMILIIVYTSIYEHIKTADNTKYTLYIILLL